MATVTAGTTRAAVRPQRTWQRYRRFVMPVIGLGVALVFLSPYLVMLLDALRPSSDVVQTPATFLPRVWQLSTFSDVLVRATSGAPGATVVVDLDGVHVFDDAGLGLLLGAAGRARQTGGDLVVVCSTPGLRHHLELTRFDRAVRVVDGMSELP